MKKQYYLPIYTRYDSDGDVDGTFYLVRGHQQPQLMCDGSSFMGFDEKAQFTKKQANQAIKSILSNRSHCKTIKMVIYIGSVIKQLDKFDRLMGEHVADSFFWDWKIIPKKQLINTLLKAHIDTNTDVKVIIKHRMIPCKPYDKKLASNLNKEVQDAENSNQATTASDMADFIDQCDEDDKKDKLMQAKYFVPRLKKDLKKIKESKH